MFITTAVKMSVFKMLRPMVGVVGVLRGTVENNEIYTIAHLPTVTETLQEKMALE